MVDIKLQEGQSGYDVVGEYIRRYWKHNIYETVVVSLGISYDGKTYGLLKEVASPYWDNCYAVYLYDWWEGQKFIKIFGIKSINKLDISGGLYEED